MTKEQKFDLSDAKYRVEADSDIDGRDWFKMPKEGDFIQGTLVARRSGTTQQGDPQILYDLNVAEGDEFTTNGETIPAPEMMKFTVGSKPSIDRQMKTVQLGQIIRMEFTKTSRTKNGYNFKEVAVSAHADYVDEKWLKANPDARKIESAFGAGATEVAEEEIETVEYKD